MRIETIPCHSWNELRGELYRELFDEDRFEEGRFLFRGVGDEEWKLESSFDRYAADIPPTGREEAATRLLELFAEECASDEAIGSCPTDHEQRIALAQHHGLPTRALDWSLSPYVAAFFAFAAITPNGSAPSSPNIALWALDMSNGLWRGGLGARILRPDVPHSDRILRQRGFMTRLQAPQSSLEEWANECPGDEIALWKFLVPRDDAPIALADLSAMGISATRLFPDLTGAARGAQARFQHTRH